jgi:hypothetical protein
VREAKCGPQPNSFKTTRNERGEKVCTALITFRAPVRFSRMSVRSENDLRRKIMWCCSETWLVAGVGTSFCIDIWIWLVTSIKISLCTDTWIWFVDCILTFHSWSHRRVGTSFGWIYRISYTLTLGTVYGSNNLLNMETIFLKNIKIIIVMASYNMNNEQLFIWQYYSGL